MRGLAALCVSLVLHGLLAVALAGYLNRAQRPECLAQLDLSSVDLSFAETPDDSVPESPSIPSAASPAVPPPSPQMTPPTRSDDLSESVPRAEVATIQDPTVSCEMMDAPPESARPDEAESAVPAPAIAPRQAKVDAPPRPRRAIRPDYPRESRQRGEQGGVTVELAVGVDGEVTDAHVAVSSGFPLLDAAAVSAVRAARFVPAKSDGRPVASTARLSLEFKLK